MHFLSVLTDSVCRPLATVRVAYLRVAFQCHIAGIMLDFFVFREKFVNSERIFLHEPCLSFYDFQSFSHQLSKGEKVV